MFKTNLYEGICRVANFIHCTCLQIQEKRDTNYTNSIGYAKCRLSGAECIDKAWKYKISRKKFLLAKLILNAEMGLAHIKLYHGYENHDLSIFSTIKHYSKLQTFFYD